MEMMVDPRQSSILEAAHAVFFRFGFRKTTMDEIAQAAGISRQALYLRFASKEDLFRAMVTATLQRTLSEASAALQADEPLEIRLVRAMDAWLGAYVETIRNDVADLTEAAFRFADPQTRRTEDVLLNAIAECMDEAGLVAACSPATRSGRLLAEIFVASMQGIRRTCSTREEFLDKITVASRVFCLPISTTNSERERPAAAAISG